VEQKIATLVRAYLGDRRLDSVSQIFALNVLYDQMWAYYNLFQPVMHLAEKQVIQEPGKPVPLRRKHDQPVTPFERLCRTSAILPEHTEQLEALRDSINPRHLRQDIYDAIDALFKLPGAVPGLPTLPTPPTTAAVTFRHTDERRGTFWKHYHLTEQCCFGNIFI